MILSSAVYAIYKIINTEQHHYVLAYDIVADSNASKNELIQVQAIDPINHASADVVEFNAPLRGVYYVVALQKNKLNLGGSLCR
jgi:hypothetical protein